MSTGLNCALVETAPDQWYYLLEDDDAPQMSWDWREHATAHGPFPTLEAAEQHLSDNHPNPGGYTVDPYQPGEGPDPFLLALTEGASLSSMVNGVEVRYDNAWSTWVAELNYYGLHDRDQAGRCEQHDVAWIVEYCGPGRRAHTAAERQESKDAALRIARNREAISTAVLTAAEQTGRGGDTHQRLKIAFDGDQMRVTDYDQQRWTQLIPAVP